MTTTEPDSGAFDWSGLTLFLLSIGVVALCGLIVWPFLPGIVGAVILAVVAAPLNRWLRRRVHQRTVAASLALAAIFISVVIPLLLIGQAGMFLSLLVLGVCFGISAQAAQPQLIGWVIFAFIAIYVGFFAIGLGPVFWLLISEIFPLAVRARGMSIATILNWLFNMLVSFTFLDLTSAIGRNGTFFLYAGLTAISIVFTFYLVPETKGRSLEQIEAKLRG